MTKFKKLLTFEHILLSLLLLLAGLTHGINMFHFPYFENDEGVYVSQAWSLVTQGKLAPYTYWYDHAPAGWIFIALWSLLTGGFFTFGFSIDTGRVCMLVLHVLSSFFLFKISKNLFKSIIPGTIAILLFSFSPLGVYFQRRVLLDNIMVFWVLFSLFFLSIQQIKLRHVTLSALAFGIAILSKENAIFFIPGFLLLLFFQLHKNHKQFGFGLWISLVCCIVSTYFLYASIKGELFPTGTLLGGSSQHVSLIGSLQLQFSRGSGAGFFDIQHNLFWHNFFYWYHADAFFIIAGGIATVLCLCIGIRNKFYLTLSLMSIFFWVFLIRGGVVIEFYIVPLLPFLGLLIGTSVLFVIRLCNKLFKSNLFYQTLTICCVIGISLPYVINHGNARGLNLYTSDQTTPQIQAIDWMKKNLSPKSFVVIDNYGYIDLHDKVAGKNSFGYAEWYWKVDRDPAIRDKLLKDNPANITYIALTPQMQDDMRASGLDMILDASHNASPIKRFWKDGWGVEFWSTRYPQQILHETWNSYKKNFLLLDGQTIDPYTNNRTTSEGQSYTMLRAVWIGDKQQFDTTWNWTKNNMQLSNKLFRWKVEQDGSVDDGSATDADEDIALALAFASKKWKDSSYLSESKAIIQNIWNNDTKVVNNIPYIIAGDWAKDKSVAIINPSYLSPYSYKIFAKIDTKHPWVQVVNSSYSALASCSENNLGTSHSTGLVPDWCAIDQKGKTIVSPEKGLNATTYSYDAFRSTWRVALDAIWNNDGRAKNFLSSQTFLQNQWNQKHRLTASYTHDGKIWENYETASAYGADIGNFIVTNPDDAADIYREKILGKLYTNGDNSYWEDPKNYYVQNWAWFGTALYTGNLPNLWEKATF